MVNRSTKLTKVYWLLDRETMWEGWPRGAHGADARHCEIVDAMKKDGLVSPKTNFADINLTNLIIEARWIRRRAKSGA